MRYEASGITPGPADLGGVSWQRCVASDLPRARDTAGHVFPGTVECSPLLREADFAPFPLGGIRLPVRVWKWVYQAAWALGLPSQRACRDAFHRRVREAMALLSTGDQDTLVVSHAGMMAHLGKALRAEGWRGPKIHLAAHARVYRYERPNTC